MIRGVIFDLGWTLMYYDTDWNEVNQRACHHLAEFLRANGTPVSNDFPGQFHAARQRGWKRADETGIEHTAEQALYDALTTAGYALPSDGILPRAVREFFKEPESHWLPYADSLATLQELARRNLRVGLISNADDVDIVFNQIKRMGLAPYLSPMLSSAQEPRWRKPDPRIFQIVANAWQIMPSDIAMVGDAPMFDVLGAHRAGMRAIWIDRNENFWWQKIPDTLANDPAVHADAVVHTLAEIPNMLDNWLI